jgi:hypothetical protein
VPQKRSAVRLTQRLRPAAETLAAPPGENYGLYIGKIDIDNESVLSPRAAVMI